MEYLRLSLLLGVVVSLLQPPPYGDELPAVPEEHQQENQGVRLLGQERGLFTVPKDFNAPLPDELLAAFENGSQ